MAHIETITAPLFSKVLQETKPTQPLGGVSGVKKVREIYLQPHSYRLFFDFNKENFTFFLEDNPAQGNQGAGLLFPLEHRPINNGHEFFYRFDNFTVRLKKKTICITNLFEHKRLYPVDITQNVDSQLKRCIEICREKNRQTLGFLRAFIGQYGGSSSYQLTEAPKIDIKHFDDRIEPLLPLRKRWHNDVMKKEYNEKKIETHDWLYTAQLLRNQAINDVAPQIAEELRDIKDALTSKMGVGAVAPAPVSSFDYKPTIDLLVSWGQDRAHCELFFGVNR